ncbi:MAG: ferritin [Amoebophilaceae bacterium]|nr:ferritin [Amoebophilaceae bacterium]
MKSEHLKSRLTTKVSELLNEQIMHENNISLQYLQMACWAEKNDYTHASKFFYKQAEEERTHMFKLIKYVHDMGGDIVIKNETNSPIRTDFNTLKELFVMALACEITTSKAINHMVNYCLDDKDFMTFGFLQWFVLEQIEEEAVARKHVGLFEVMEKQEGMAIHMVDLAIGKGITA